MEFKTISAADLMSLSEEQLGKTVTQERDEHRKMIDALGASESIKKKARAISKRKTSCSQCVYNGRDGFSCWVPYSDAYMEDLKINPCYEGVLRYLIKQ